MPLQHMRVAASTRITRACLTRYVPSPGVLTLLTACSASTPPGLFHPGSAHGVRPFRAFSSRGAVAPSGARCLPDVPARGPTRQPATMSSRAEPWFVRADPPPPTTEADAGRLQGIAPLESSLPSSGGLDRQRLDALLGFTSLQGLHCPCLTRRFTPRNSRERRRRSLPATEVAGSLRRPLFEAYRPGSLPLSLETGCPS